jgi:TRAP-type mannitol/chloroaromatic compound transport system substrate-binding protein
MRFFGLGANVMQKLGVATQLLQAGEIFQALQLGTIDATEFSMPAMDLTLGFHQVAKHYYFPGWHQQSTLNDLIHLEEEVGRLSKTQQLDRPDRLCTEYAEQCSPRARRAGRRDAGDPSQGRDAALLAEGNPRRLREGLDRGRQRAGEKSPEFKKAWDSYSKFRKNYKVWRDHGYLK